MKTEQAKSKPFAIVHKVKTNHKAIAICEVWEYDVWGNARDGFQVNDSYCLSRKAEIPATLTLSNVPTFPGAKDDFRAFPADGSFSAEIGLFFELDKRAMRQWIKGKDNGDGDDLHYYFENPHNGKPMGEILVVGWKAFED